MISLVYGLSALFGVCMLLAAVCYIPKFFQLAGARKKPERKSASKQRTIALVIPARNESGTIGALFHSILQQTYPCDRFDVNVIVKEADDPTCAMAKKIGANVFVVPAQTCKGAALDGYFHSLSPEQLRRYDAFAIVDADAVLSDTYVEELNNALEYDRDIFVTRKNIKNYLGGKAARSLICDCSALTYPIIDELGNAYRSAKNVPLNLCGQGLMVRRRVIERLNGWPYRSLTEDYELKMDGYLHGFSGMFYPYAVLYTEEVLQHKESYLRRLRWIRGYSQCDRMYKKRIQEKIRRDGASPAVKFDFLHFKDAFYLYTGGLAAALSGGTALFITGLAGGSVLWAYALGLLIALPLACTYLILLSYTAMAMCAYRDVLTGFTAARKLRLLLFHPLFLLEYIPIYIQSRTEKTQGAWKETARLSTPLSCKE